MKTSTVLVPALLLLGCVDGDANESVDGASVPRDAGAGSDAAGPDADEVADSLAAEGYEVRRGHFGWLGIEDCHDEATCYGANYVSPYGLIFLPAADDEALPELPPFFVDGDERAMWRLRSDEAVILFGTTPPSMAYFGLTPYLFSRAGEELFASLGDTLNPDVIGADAFGAPFAYVMTSSQATSEAVVASLEAAGFAPSSIHVQPLPSDRLRWGHDQDADVLSFLMRVALPDDPDALAAYRAAPPLTVFRVTAREPRAADPLPELPLRPEGLPGVDEASLESSLDALEEAIRETTRGSVTSFREVDLDGYECIESGSSCLGDNNDTPYFVSLLPRTLEEDDRIVVFGVRHDRTNLATYVGLSVNAIEGQVAVAGFTGEDTDGSAQMYLPDDPNAEKLFVMTLARDCSDDPGCVEVPTGELGAPLDEALILVWRAYLQPGTRTGPAGEDLLAPRSIRVR